MTRRESNRASAGAGMSVGIILAVAFGEWLLSDATCGLIAALQAFTR